MRYRNLFGILSRCLSTRTPSNLERAMLSKIKLKGPITVADYMKEALSNPIWGYYMKKDVFGQRGDFTTAPEVSQMFGELVGVWLLNEWALLKSFYADDLPKCVQLVELGPGRGTLMNDVLKVWSRNQDASQELYVHMVERSPFMRDTQFNKLCRNDRAKQPELGVLYPSKISDNIKITWISDIVELAKREAPHFFFANEFFDALPVQKFQKKPDKDVHREILVDWDEKTNKFKFVLSPRSTIGLMILNLYPGYEKFDHIEVSFESARYIEAIGKILSEYNGSMLTIDYGHDGAPSDTLRAFKSHQQVDVFDSPGECDLTVDVDFGFLKHIAKKSDMTCYGPISQGSFLKEMQIEARLKKLLEASGSESEKAKLQSEYEMLVRADKMGERFKLMAIRKFDFKQTPPGFN